MKVKTKELREYFGTLKYDDFHNGKIKKLNGDVELGNYFITDFSGGELSLCKRKKNHKVGRNWKKEIELVEVLIPNCEHSYNSSINGPFEIPKNFIID